MDWIDQILIFGAVFLVLTLIGITIFIVVHVSKHKYRIQIRRLVHDRVLLENDKARPFVDKDGNRWLKRLKGASTEKLMPMPPAESQELDKKGVIHATANLLEDGSYVWMSSQYDSKTIKTLSSDQRMSLAHQLRKANERRKFTWKEYIPLIANGIIVLLILVSFMIFFNEVVEPAVELGESISSAGQHFKEAAETYAALDSDVQKLLDQAGIEDSSTEEAPN